MTETCAKHKDFTVIYDVLRGGNCPVCRAEANHLVTLAKYRRLEEQYDKLETTLVKTTNKRPRKENKNG